MSSNSLATLVDFVDVRYARLLGRCREAGVVLHDDAGVAEHVQRVLLASDFAYEAWLREPELLAPEGLDRMVDPRHAELRPPTLADGLDEAEAMRVLRRYRRCEALRLIWRDVNGLDSLEDTLTGASALAEVCLSAAHDRIERILKQRHGTPRGESGIAQRLVVIALGKLGGGELNFSSDVDLLFAYPENGTSDGPRPLANETWFARQGQALVKWLGEITAEGHVFRVDLRLRPFGSAGRLALSFAAMEQYYQREGRDWERYAWIKARPVAGDIAAGQQLLQTLRPFVYRRYLDYTALAGLREMKALIDAEVARKDRSRNLKLGPGGIREIEFIVQLLQLIRGGREPSLRERGVLPALAACERLGALPAARARRLREAYRFLRRVENRLQMMRDEQTHELPEDPFLRLRLAAGLGYRDATAFLAELDRVRAAVAEEFAAVLAPAASNRRASGAAAQYWLRLCAGEANSGELAALGFAEAETLHAQAAALVANPSARALSGHARNRLDRLLPRLLEAAAASSVPAPCLARLLRLIHAVLRRPAYLALLEEQPAARERVVAIFADSALLAERVIAHPLLLDELFDAASAAQAGDATTLDLEIRRRLGELGGEDAEAEIEILQEEKQSAMFRIGLAYRDGHDAVRTAYELARVADVLVGHAFDLATRDMARQHGKLTRGSMAVVAYGSLGGAELGFASDLDLVFVHAGLAGEGESDGLRPLDATRYGARLAQRTVHWLTTPTHAGRLYEVDVRLRPDGAKGPLVVGLEAFAEYQRARAWVWETQALVRARPIAGDPELCGRFVATRAAMLARPRPATEVLAQVSAMRARWRAERDRSTVDRLDLKQGPGALLDIEFIVQTLVLLEAHRRPELLESGNTARLIELAVASGVLAEQQAAVLAAAHAALLRRALDCTLDARARVVARDTELDRHTTAVLEVAAALGLAFGWG
jgi:glutamate-ammonia-ligase adenylyltransferase